MYRNTWVHVWSDFQRRNFRFFFCAPIFDGWNYWLYRQQHMTADWIESIEACVGAHSKCIWRTLLIRRHWECTARRLNKMFTGWLMFTDRVDDQRQQQQQQLKYEHFSTDGVVTQKLFDLLVFLFSLFFLLFIYFWV